MSVSKKLCGVYNIIGKVGESQALIRPIGTITLDNNEGIHDKLMDTFIIDGKIICNIHRCNILNTFLMTTKILPVYCATVMYDRPLQKIALYHLYFNFTIKQEIKSADELLNNYLDGKFSMDIIIDGVSKQLDKPIDIYPGKNKIINMFKNLLTTDGMINVARKYKEKADEDIKEKYKDDYDYKIPKATISLKDYKFDD